MTSDSLVARPHVYIGTRGFTDPLQAGAGLFCTCRAPIGAQPGGRVVSIGQAVDRYGYPYDGQLFWMGQRDQCLERLWVPRLQHLRLFPDSTNQSLDYTGVIYNWGWSTPEF